MKFDRIKVSKTSLCLILFSITFALYFKTHTYDFISLDDYSALLTNKQIHSGLNLKNLKWAFTTNHTYAYWMPLTWLSFLIDISIYGMSPGGFHLTNTIIHAINTFLVFLMFFSLTKNKVKSFAIALLFGIHPIHVESVAWISNRKDVLSAFFFFMTIISYVSYAKKKKVKYYLFSLFAYLLSLLAKPTAITLPAILFLLDFWPLKQMHVSSTLVHYLDIIKINKRLIFEKLTFLFFAIADTATTLLFTTSDNSTYSYETLPFFYRFTNAIVSYVSYLSKLFFPIGLGVFYPHPFLNKTPPFNWIGAMLLLIAITIFFINNRHKHPYLIVGWFWFILMLLPAIGFAQTGDQAMADRFVYLPALGFYFAVTSIIAQLNKKVKKAKSLIFPLSIIVYSGLFIVANNQISFWQNSQRLYIHTLNITKKNPTIHFTLGSVLYAENNHSAEALEHLKKAIQFRPYYYEAVYGVGLWYGMNNQKDSSFKYLDSAISIDSGYIPPYLFKGEILRRGKEYQNAINIYTKALKFDSSNLKILLNMSETYQEMGLEHQSCSVIRKTMFFYPRNFDVLHLHGRCCFRRQEYDSSKAYFIEALKYDSTNSATWNSLGLTFQKLGDANKALYCFNNAVLFIPQNEMKPLLNRALLFMQLNKPYKGLQDINHALKISPENVIALDLKKRILEKIK